MAVNSISAPIEVWMDIKNKGLSNSKVFQIGYKTLKEFGSFQEYMEFRNKMSENENQIKIVREENERLVTQIVNFERRNSRLREHLFSLGMTLEQIKLIEGA